jgi:hypothetical protein
MSKILGTLGFDRDDEYVVTEVAHTIPHNCYHRYDYHIVGPALYDDVKIDQLVAYARDLYMQRGHFYGRVDDIRYHQDGEVIRICCVSEVDTGD